MSEPRVPSRFQAVDRCPRCNAPRGTLSLLTSMSRYYVCGRCRCQWQILRAEECDQPMRDRMLATHGDTA